MPTLPAKITVVELPDGVVFVLPPRDLGSPRFVGCLLAAFGICFFALSGGAALLSLVTRMSGGEAIETTELLLTVAIALPFALIGLLLVGLGSLIFAGRSEVEVRGETLRVVERVGVIRWVRRRPLAGIERFNITSLAEQRPRDGEPRGDVPVVKIGDDAPLDFIAVEGNEIQSIKIAGGYPRPMLRELAAALAECVQRAIATALPRPPIQIVESQPMLNRPQTQRLGKTLGQEDDAAGGEATATVSSEDAAKAKPPLVQPASSRAELLRESDGLTIVLPPEGFRRTNLSMLLFAIFWMAIVIGITTVMIRQGFPARGLTAWAPGLFLVPFWAIGIGMFTLAINLARRHAVIGVVGDTLLVTQTSIFRTTEREWTRDQIRHIRRGDSGMKINNRPVLDLKIILDDESTKGLFAGRDPEELDWIADVLRRELKLE